MKTGAAVANFLNLAATEPLLQPQCCAVERVVLELTALTEEVSRAIAKRTSGKLTDAARVEAIRRINARTRQVEQFNALLRPYTWQVELVGWDKKGIPIFWDLPTSPDLIEMSTLIGLARAQLLDRVRKCGQCGVWFFARKPWADYCSTPCRKTKFRSTPKSQEKNKKYYREKLSPNQRYYLKGLSPAEVRELKKKRKRTKERSRHGRKR